MKKANHLLAKLLLSAVLIAAAGQLFYARGQNAANPEQQLKAKWTKALKQAQRDFQNTNDRESAAFVGKMLDAINLPGGVEATALADYGRQLKAQTGELFRRNALESAAVLNYAQRQTQEQPGPGADAPIGPSHQGGLPGPGGLVLYMPFDRQPKDGVVQDESGAGNQGHVEGAKWVSEGRFGGAFQFSLTNLTDRIVVPDSDTLGVRFFTLAAWIKTTDADGVWNRIVDKDSRKGYALILGGDINGTKDCRGRVCLGTDDRWMGAEHKVGDGRWHHVAGTFDGQTSRIYLDGVELIKQRFEGHPGPTSRNHWDLCIGNSVVDFGTSEYMGFDGLIDEVRIYNRALSAAEIKALASAIEAGVEIFGASKADNAPKPDTAERLKKVKSLYEQGLITKEDYDKKVKEIMDSL